MTNDIKVVRASGNDECVEVVLPYTSNMTAYSNNNIVFNSPCIGVVTENKYLTDDRRKAWEDSNQPMRRRKLPFGKSRLYVNQLLDFNVPYIIVRDGNIKQLTAVKVDGRDYVIDEEPKLKATHKVLCLPSEVQRIATAVSTKDKNAITISGDGRILNLDVTEEEYQEKIHNYLSYLSSKECNYHFDSNLGTIISNDSNANIPDVIFDRTEPIVIIHPENSPTELERLSFKTAGIYDNLIITEKESFQARGYTQDQAEELLSRVDTKKNSHAPNLTKKKIKRPFWSIENK